MNQKHILVTGGAGYIGSHTVRRLCRDGYRVTVIDNLVYGHREALPGNVTLHEGDIGDADLVKMIFGTETFDAVIHFAAWAYVGESVTAPDKYYRNNTAAPLVLLDAMRRAGCRKLVFSSTCATYGSPVRVPIDESHPQQPINPYGASKLMLERILADYSRAYGISSVSLRYFNAAGASPAGGIGEDHSPETHLIPLVLQAAQGTGRAITVFGTDYDTPDGTCIRDYIHVDDLADGHLRALAYLEQGGETTAVNLGTGRGSSVKEIITAVEKVTGRKVPVTWGPRRAGDPAELAADPARAASLLGWKAEYTDIEQIIETAWRWHDGPDKGQYPAGMGTALASAAP